MSKEVKKQEEQVPVIRINGVQREVKYPVMAVMRMEKELGMSSIKLLQKGPGDPFTIHELIVMIWAGILHSWPRITVEAVSEWIMEEGFEFDKAVEICKTELLLSLRQILHIREEEPAENEGKN